MALNKFIWPALAWTVFITVLCLASMNTFSSFSAFNFAYKDKAVHAAFYFVFTIFWYLNFKGGRHNKNLKFRVFAFAVVYGGIVELCQGLFTAERSADIMDVFANAAGSALAILVVWLVNRNKK